jgi:hypothetical protein
LPQKPHHFAGPVMLALRFIMRKPLVIEYWCDDQESIESWVPEDTSDFDFYLNMMIGCDQHAGDNFTVHVVSPNNIEPGSEAKKYLIVLSVYSWESLKNEIDSILEKCANISWFGMQEELSKHFHWEYEGMVPPYKT